MSISNLTPVQLRQAASILEKIEKLQNKLNHIHGVKVAAPAAGKVGRPPKKARKKISAAGIARIRAAQKARWAKIHAAKGK
jgi:hypothetical protein